MTIDRTIEILTDLLGEGPQFPPDDRREAVKLGIEALTFIKLSRATLSEFIPELFHGETKEKRR